MIARTKWLLLGAPLLSDCCFGLGTCPSRAIVWDGGLADGGTAPTLATIDPATCSSLNCSSCTVIDAGLIECAERCVGGRAPPGLKSLSACDGSAGSWLSRMAELEQAAVRAFMHLSRELDAHGLPRHAAYALRAAEHEVHHARAVTKLALSRGHCPRLGAIEDTPLRSLEEVALDNAAEGCGREAFGAVINFHQAAHAADADVAQAFAAIAPDEAQHAHFSFELAGALMPKLTVAQRRRAREAQALALTRLSGSEMVGAAARTLGMMDQAQSRAAATRMLETARI
jgi:rubrerythrin